MTRERGTFDRMFYTWYGVIVMAGANCWVAFFLTSEFLGGIDGYRLTTLGPYYLENHGKVLEVSRRTWATVRLARYTGFAGGATTVGTIVLYLLLVTSYGPRRESHAAHTIGVTLFLIFFLLALGPPALSILGAL